MNLSDDFQLKLFKFIQKLAEKSNHSYCIVDSDFRILTCNQPFEELTGYPKDKLLDTHYLTLIEDKKSSQYLSKIAKRIHEGKMSRAHVVHRRKKQAPFYAEIDVAPFENHDGEIEFILFFVRDITSMQLQNFMARIEQEISHAIQQEKTLNQKLEIICNGIDSMFYQHSLTSIAMKDESSIRLVQSSIIEDEEKVVKLIRPKEVQFYNQVIQQDDIIIYEYISSLPLYRKLLEYAIEQKLHCCVLIPIKRQDGENIGVINIMFSELYINEKVYFKFFEKLVDLITLAYTYEMKQREVHQLAYYDSYIGIRNRQGFIKKMKKKIDMTKGGYIQLIEAGEFSKIVELYGRDMGENVLKQICDRIFRTYSEQSMFMGRFSSSALILYVADGEDLPEILPQYIEQIVEQPFVVANKSFYISLKSGVAKIEEARVLPQVPERLFTAPIRPLSEQLVENVLDYSYTDDTPAFLEEAIRFSERALTTAKDYSGTYTNFYVRRDDEDLERELNVLNELIESIEKQDFQLYLQPKVELHRGRIYGFEALARWRSQKLGFISPAEFIPIAEKAGLIRKIDLIIIEKILKWMQQRQYEGKKIMPVAVNISPVHFYHPDFICTLKGLVDKYYADPNFILIEVTEGIGLVEVERAVQIINRLNALGFSTSVDDFGMGYSSLSYLQKLRFSEIKIDRVFISNIDEITSLAIVKAILMMAKNLGVTTVAEGVETLEQQQVLKELGVEVVQGFLHYKPAPLEEIRKLLDEN